ncbi:MAG: PTS transporter subunit EIIC [Romboutsia sp.]|nr:PTS transporter subunit EIIC [Romboutsia sp.]
MLKFLQKIGKSLMLPVAALPVAGILMGIGYWIDPTGWGANNIVAAFLLKAGGALIDNMAILFAIGVGVGMSDDNDGTGGLAGLVSWLVITTLLSTSTVAMLMGVDVAEVPAAFGKIQNQFIGILSGVIGASCYNKFKNTKLPDALGFFSGKRCVAIMTSLVSLVVSLILFFAFPMIYNGLVNIGTAIVSAGALGAGIFGFLNRLLIPVGMHHALNSVFWFDVAGINDLGNFWAGTGTQGVTGIYMTGFFPVMMFGLPAGALAMYHTAKESKKKAAAGILLAAALSSFFTGVTEPLEFAFMFLAPGLYLVHAILTGISMFVCALLPMRAGFNFSAGFVDWFLSFKAPMAESPMLLIAVGLVFAALYYVSFRFMIVKFNLMTPGREEDEVEVQVNTKASFDELAVKYIEYLGGAENLVKIDNCITRLRLEIKDSSVVNDKGLKELGAKGVVKLSKNSIQVIVGPNVQFVADGIKKSVNSVTSK